MVLAVIIFHVCLVLIFILFGLFGLKVQGVLQVVAYGVPALIAIYPKIKKEKRVLELSEKLLFTLFTWGIITAIIFGYVVTNTNIKPTTAGILTVVFEFFLSFCGVWLIISTFTPKIFGKSLKNA